MEDVIKIFISAATSFFLGMMMTPLLTHYLYKYKAWKKTPGKIALDGNSAQVYGSLHGETEIKTPRMGGLIIWISTAVTALIYILSASVFDTEFFTRMNFISRSQTWLPLFAIIVGGLVGLTDDLLEIRGKKENDRNGGLSLNKRLLIVGAIALFAALWFYTKLEINAIAIPFDSELYLGILFIPIFVLIALTVYAGGVIDGIDGLAGGVFAVIYSAYAAIAFFQDQPNLAAFCAAVAGSILAFLWYNIPPARFYMSETGSMALTIVLVMVAFLTDTLTEGIGVSALFIIALPLFLTVLSNVLQIASKYFFGRKIFRVAPLHHHFEAIGWPAYKVTMRYWIISVVLGIIGVIIALTG